MDLDAPVRSWKRRSYGPPEPSRCPCGAIRERRRQKCDPCVDYARFLNNVVRFGPEKEANRERRFVRLHPATQALRLIRRAEPQDDCLQCHSLAGSGYPNAFEYLDEDGTKRSMTAHRLVYFALVGPLRGGEHVHHKCGNAGCIRPEHLERATAAENNLEMIARNDYEQRIEELEDRLRDLGIEP